MRNKKIFSFDEERDAQKVVEEGFPNGKIDYSKMYLVAKYFRHERGFGEIRLEKELIRFCLEQDKNFNPVVEAESIRKWIVTAMSYGLRKVTAIPITQKEIDFLNSIEVQKDRKLLFITLVLSKALKQQNTRLNKKENKKYENCYIHYGNILDVVRLSRMSNLSETKLMDIFFKYNDHLTLYNPEKELIRIDYADSEGEEVVIIDQLEKMNEYFDKVFIKMSKVSKCKYCGEEFIKNANNQVLCLSCAKEERKKKQKELMRKRRTRKNYVSKLS